MQLTFSNSIGKSIIQVKVPSVSRDVSVEEYLEKFEELSSPSTISLKAENGSYDANIYDLYHDFKLVTVHELVQHAIGSKKYRELRSLHESLIDLILREGERLGYFKPQEAGKAPEAGFEGEVFNGYRRIFTDVQESYGEAYFIVSQNSGPLFTSINGKSAIDPRDTETHGQFNTTKVVPLTQNYITPYQLGFLSPATASVPHPAVPPTELLREFVHPTRSALPATKWLKYDEYSSFAPSLDNSSAVLSDGVSGAIWYNRTEESFDKDKKINDSDVSMDDVRPEERDNVVNTVIKPEDFTEADIDLLSVFEWTPGNEIDEEELESYNSQEGVSAYLSKLLLQVQYYQRARLSSNDGSEFKVDDEEKRVALKAQNLLARLASDYTPKELGFNVSSNLPMLSVNYQGTLPGTDRSIQPQARFPHISRPQGRPRGSTRR